MKTVTIAPVAGGWSIHAEGLADMMVKSGAKAEQAAERLAKALSFDGEPVELRVELANGGHVARFISAPSALAGRLRGGSGVEAA